ncbi:MAG: hypothetical protein KJ052_18805 [Candidatus Hydrogenedentes bacterium]|nr:hypothetical protein [Candidatus Hydrogenedentota bacterium]
MTSPVRTISRKEITDLTPLPLLLKRSGGNVILFPDSNYGSYTLPTNLIADNHLWELKD